VTLLFTALMYSIFGVAISKMRGADDELNTLAAGGATGLLYKSSGICVTYMIGNNECQGVILEPLFEYNNNNIGFFSGYNALYILLV